MNKITPIVLAALLYSASGEGPIKTRLGQLHAKTLAETESTVQ
jgi:hypothetical protein